MIMRFKPRLLPCLAGACVFFVVACGSVVSRGVIGRGLSSDTLAIEQVFDRLPEQPVLTQVDLVNENVNAWYSRWRLVSQAKDRLDVVYFIVEPNDIYGKAFLGLLLKKAHEGVKIRFLIDAHGSPDLAKTEIPGLLGGHPYLLALVRAGVEVGTFNPFYRVGVDSLAAAVGLQEKDVRRLIASDHDKIVVVDGNLSMIGGRNIGQLYLSDPADSPRVYRDTDVLLEDPRLAASLTKAFEVELDSDHTSRIQPGLISLGDTSDELLFYVVAMERWITGGDIEGLPATLDYQKAYIQELRTATKSRGYLCYRPFSAPDPAQNRAEVKVLDKTSILGGQNDISAALLGLIASAEQEIIIQNPYIILTDAARAALQAANDRNVKILIHTNSPNSTDELATQAFFLDDWIGLMKSMNNLEIWVYPESQLQLHSKVFIFDRKVAAIASYNMDYMSDQINSEVFGVFKGDSFVKLVRDRIVNDDFALSKKYEIEVQPDGSVKVIYGPLSTTSDPKTIIMLQMIRQAKFLRPLI